MKNSKLEAIAHLQSAFNHNKEFKKAWTDYIELAIIEELENNKIKLPHAVLRKFVTSSSDHIIRLFDADWWENQRYIK